MTLETVVRERPLQFGPDGHLVGVLAMPGSTEATSARSVVLFLNAGVIHRVGPHRLHVNLARRLATSGVTSLRLDLSGIGDSRPIPGALSFRQSAVADARTAMDWLAAETGLTRFVLFGLCSGADNALATAMVDERVVGLVVVDPPAYVTPQARVRKLVTRLRGLGGPRAIAAWAAGGVMRRLGMATPSEFVGGREVPPPGEFRAQLVTLVDRGVAILAVFSGDLGERYNHADQLFELFPELRGRIDRVHFPAANHVFTGLEAQAALTSTVTDWIARVIR